MNTYKYDVHVHTSETSSCGKVKGAELVHLYKEAGYSGVTITDHYYRKYFEKLGDISWEEKIDKYMSGYREALAEGRRIGITVTFGMEIAFYDSPNDYLVYGLDEAFIKINPELYNLGIEKFREFIPDKGVLIYQAHPYRVNLTRANPLYLDGVEVFNGNPRHNSSNHLAYAFASENNLRMISGSDFHQTVDLARGGIIVPETIETTSDLVELLKDDRILELIQS